MLHRAGVQDPVRGRSPAHGDSPEEMRETGKLTPMFPSLGLSPLETVPAQKHPNPLQVFPTSDLSDSVLIPQSQELCSLLTQTMVQRHHSSSLFGSSHLNFSPIPFKVNMRFPKYGEQQLLLWKVGHKIVLIKCSEKWGLGADTFSRPPTIQWCRDRQPSNGIKTTWM